MIRSILAALAGVLALLVLSSAVHAADSAKLPVWKADANLVSGLGPRFVVDGEEIRLPASFNLTGSQKEGPAESDPSNAGVSVPQVRILKWKGPANDNGIRPFFAMIVVPTEGMSAAERANPDQITADAVKLLTGQIGNIIAAAKKSPVQHGLVAGQPFSRQYSKGYNQRWMRAVHSLVYSTMTDRDVYIIIAADEEPMSKYSLPVFEASALTFHATDQPDTPVPDNLIDPDDAKAGDDSSDE